ncbi:DUF6134 family protein [Candidatus Phycosocius spiralis]|uniref:Uncharacterized protein n=1 Tax=Candidatus Phycosocius spiralis TaxID=2815099 RepID=A0ABQ4PT97_9PROT|nr:DUF6134 family protein [Candidatus Phycosocius spiralis]GIU66208.1 hypothetical protein PsB1_0362 [Candidatus Phycosocius spiralis]
MAHSLPHVLCTTYLIALSLVWLPSQTSASVAGRTEFEILMNGKPVGRHSVSVSRANDLTTVRIAVDMAGKIGPIGFTYSHRCEETWRGQQLTSLDCTDKENRTIKSVEAKFSGDQLVVNGSGFKGKAPTGIVPSSWWRRSTVNQARLLDSRDGKLSRVNVDRIGSDIVLINGNAVQTNHYRLRGTVNKDIWYDNAGRWVRTAFKIAGQRFDYRKLTPLAASPHE